MKKIRKGDRVLVTAGNNKGLAGEVLVRSEDRIVVQGVNLRKKHMRPLQQMQGGRIVEMEMPIHISNVCLCDKDNRPIYLKVRQEKNNERTLVYRNGSEEVVYRSVKKPA